MSQIVSSRHVDAFPRLIFLLNQFDSTETVADLVDHNGVSYTSGRNTVDGLSIVDVGGGRSVLRSDLSDQLLGGVALEAVGTSSVFVLSTFSVVNYKGPEPCIFDAYCIPCNATDIDGTWFTMEGIPSREGYYSFELPVAGPYRLCQLTPEFERDPWSVQYDFFVYD